MRSRRVEPLILPTAGDRPVVLHVMGCQSVQYGTFEDNLVGLAKVCSERGLSCWFVYPGPLAVPRFAADVEAAGGRVVILEASAAAPYTAFRAVRRLIRGVLPVAVHAHFNRTAYVTVLAARVAGVPRVIYTKHHESWPAISRWHALVLRLISRLVDAMICVSPVVEREARSAGVPANKLEVIEFGVDAARYAPDPSAAADLAREQGLPAAGRLVVCISHLRDPKGIDVLLHAWELMNPNSADTTLLIAGDGVLGGQLRAQAAASPVADSVRFLGVRQDVPRLLAACDVFVCPSLSEAGGLNILEALSAGAPTVTTIVGLAHSLVEEDVFLGVPVGDPHALAAALVELLDDEAARRRLGGRARETVLESRSVEASAQRIGGLYVPENGMSAVTAGPAVSTESVAEMQFSDSPVLGPEPLVTDAVDAPGPGSENELHVDVRNQTRDVLSRSLVMFGAKGATWLLAFIMTVALPRFLGPTIFGRLYFAISITSLFAILVDFGLNQFVVREVSRRQEDTTRYLLNAALAKLGLWGIALVAMTIITRLANYPPQTRAVILILTLSMLVTSLSSLVVAVLQASDRVRWVSITSVVEKAVYVGLGFAALVLGYSIIAVSIAILLGAVTALLLDLFWLRRLSKEVVLHGGWRGVEIFPLLRKSLPFFSVLMFGAVYFRIDVLVLSIMKGDTAVGWYGAAYRLFETTNFIPEAFLFALVPVISRMALKRDRSLVMTAQKSLDLLMLCAFPLAIGTMVLSDNIITTLYGAEGFAVSAAVLRILAVAIVLMYANGVFMQLLVATDRQKRLVVTAAVAAVANLTLNLILIGRWGPIGAAVTTVATEGLVTAMNYRFLPRELTRRLTYVAPAKACAAAVIMAVPLLLLDNQNLFVLVAIGVATYALAVCVLRALPADDWTMLKSALLRLRTA